MSNKCICSPVKSIPCNAASAYYAFCLFHKEENNSSFPILLKYHSTRHLIWFHFNYTNFTSNQLLCKAYSDLKAAAGLLISIRKNERSISLHVTNTILLYRTAVLLGFFVLFLFQKGSGYAFLTSIYITYFVMCLAETRFRILHNFFFFSVKFLADNVQR